jgi:hypothetical protein
MQSDHRYGTWNQQQQQPNGPNAYFQNNGAADQSFHAALELSKRALVQAVEMDASIAPATIFNLTTSFPIQTGSGPTKCSHISLNQQCLLCDCESLLHIFTQNLQLYSSPESKQDVDLLPCSLAITHIQKNTFITSIPSSF